MLSTFCSGRLQTFSETINNNRNSRVIRVRALKARTLSPTGSKPPLSVFVVSFFSTKYSSPGRIPGASYPPMTVSELWSRGGVLSPGTRPVNSVVESPISVGSGRYFFKRTADFETGRKGGGSGKGTQLPLITARQPSLLHNACGAGAAPAAAASPASAPPLFGAPTFAGIPRPTGLGVCGRPPGFVSSVALRRSLASPFSPVRAVTRSPISWWILLKRPRSRSRTKAIVLFPPSDSASLPECPFLYNYFHCVSARRGKNTKKPLCLPKYPRDGARGGGALNKTCFEVSGAPMEPFLACLPRAWRGPAQPGKPSAGRRGLRRPPR